MKVILTEEQFRGLVFEEQYKSLGCILEDEEKNNAKNIITRLSGEKDPSTIFRTLANQLKNKSITMMAVPLILGMLLGGTVERSGIRNKMTQKLEQVWEKVKADNNRLSNKMKDDALAVADPNFQKKVEALKEYMSIAAKNQNYSPDNIQISPEKMIEACNKTGFDLPLLIAQAHLESCFGLTPRARKTNSVFSVGSYDSGKNACTYATQDDSIEPYISLMQNNYMGDKTVDDILKPGALVNTQNKRYASDKNYERKVASIRNRIISKYPVLA